MRKNIIFAAVLFSLLLHFSACGGEQTDSFDTTDDTTETTTDATDTTASDSSADDEVDISPSGISLPTWDEWEALGYDDAHKSKLIYDAVCALLSNDISGFEQLLCVSNGVYDSFRTVVIDDYKLYCESITNWFSTEEYIVLELNISKGAGDYLTQGTHRLVFDSSVYITFAKYEDFVTYYPEHNLSAAEEYVMEVESDRDFSNIRSEGKLRYHSLACFITHRLNMIDNEDRVRSKEEVRAYAEKYLGVDADTLDYDYWRCDLSVVNCGHVSYRNMPGYLCTPVSEEIRDGITVVTMQFWADYSRIVPSRKVEFHMDIVDGEYRPLKTVILEDSDFDTVLY